MLVTKAMSGDEAACAVSQELLDRSGVGLMRNEYATFRSCFLLPTTVETFEGVRTIETEDELRGVFDAVGRYFRSIGVTHLARHCVSATFKAPDVIWATHETRLVCHGTNLPREPYPTFSVLRDTPEGWRVAHSTYAIEGTHQHSEAMLRPSEPL